MGPVSFFEEVAGLPKGHQFVSSLYMFLDLLQGSWEFLCVSHLDLFPRSARVVIYGTYSSRLPLYESDLVVSHFLYQWLLRTCLIPEAFDFVHHLDVRSSFLPDFESLVSFSEEVLNTPWTSMVGYTVDVVSLLPHEERHDGPAQCGMPPIA